MDTAIRCSIYSKSAKECEGVAESEGYTCFHFSAEPRTLNIDGVSAASSGVRYLLLEAGQRFTATFPGKTVQLERVAFPSDEMLSEALRRCASRSADGCFRDDRRSDAVFALICETAGAEDPATGMHLLAAFLFLLAAGSGSMTADTPLHSAHIQNALDMIAREYPSADLTVAAVAGRLYISPAYFGTLFRQECGVSFTQYLLAFRLEKARALIRRTNKLILEIAAETGFPNATHFCTRFREAYGVTPLRDRKDARTGKGH